MGHVFVVYSIATLKNLYQNKYSEAVSSFETGFSGIISSFEESAISGFSALFSKLVFSINHIFFIKDFIIKLFEIAFPLLLKFTKIYISALILKEIS